MDDIDAQQVAAAVPYVPLQRAGSEQLSAGHTDDFADFIEFYRSFVPALVAFLMWQGARLAEATDITQETMAKACQWWSEIDHPKVWARTVASRKLARRISSIEEDFTAQLTVRNSLLPMSIDMETWGQRHEVLNVLHHLSPRQRQVIAWTLDGYCPAEIASELNISFEMVKTNLVQGRRTLATHLGTTGDEG